MFPARKDLYQQLEAARGSKLLVYVTGDRPGMETQISQEVYDKFVDHLDKIGVVPKISLYLYTRGGNVMAAWSLINLINTFCDDLEVIIPSKALSAGTLMALGAKRLVMTKQATIGPIDPSLSGGPLHPQIPGGAANTRAPVNVEEVNGFVEFARTELNIRGEEHVVKVLDQLSQRIHPLVLGAVYRTKSQIKMLAKRLLTAQISDPAKIDKLVAFLCQDSGSHDYTIHRREAKDVLGLQVEKPSADLYPKVKQIYDDIATELLLTTAWDPTACLAGHPSATYNCRRVLLESLAGGTDVFLSEGELSSNQMMTPNGMQKAISDRRDFEGWRHEN